MTPYRADILRAARLPDLTPDAVLLRGAAAGKAEAQRALVERHGPMVLRVCRHLLGDRAAADDAFQAVFLVLIRRGWRLQRPAGLAAWLFGVARRTAMKARSVATSRRGRLTRSCVQAEAEPLDDLTARELLVALDEEIDRLPHEYRLPLLLCYWQGLTQEQAAIQLGWTAGSVKGRLERGRKQLAARLGKRGLAPSVLLAAATSTVVPQELTAAALALATGIAAPAGVLALIGSGSMAKTISTMTAAVALVGAGIVGMTAGIASPQAPKNEPAPVAQPVAEQREDVVTVRGRVLDPDGKPVSNAKVYTLKMLPNKELFISDENVEPTFRTTTGKDGTFQFEIPRDKLLVEHYRMWPVMAAAEGYGLGWTRPKLPDDALTIRLVKDEPINGRIVNAQGEPVLNAKFRVLGLYTGTDDRLDAFLADWKKDWQDA